MTKNKNIHNDILYFGEYATHDNDVYFMSRFDRLKNDINSTMGIIDGKVNSIGRLKDKQEKEYYMSYIGSVLMNLMFSAGLFEGSKAEFLATMGQFYDEREKQQN